MLLPGKNVSFGVTKVPYPYEIDPIFASFLST